MAALLSASFWLWREVREAHNTWGALTIQTEQSRLFEARRTEEMLRDGRIDEALRHLQRNRDLSVLQLDATRSAIDIGSWRWGYDEQMLDSAASALREEAEYRRTVGESDSKVAQQVKTVLDEFTE
jgi:hypothetical protein